MTANSVEGLHELEMEAAGRWEADRRKIMAETHTERQASDA